ncbi:MAG: cobalt ECF transporter T component CbiQ [Acidimicrobiales bacterium]
MGTGHKHAGSLHVHGHSVVHELPAEAKIVATVAFVFAVVATPRTAMWAFALHAAVILGVAASAGISPLTVVRRLVVEVPFVAFAFFLPIIGTGERVSVLGLSLSEAGLWAAWNILAKGTLGVAAATVLAVTTSVRDLLAGLERLRMPRVLVQICSFMVRYGEVISNEMKRMRIARQSRGHDPRWIWQARAVATSAGALFIRSFERGERVYVAMQSRGYAGSMPVTAEHDTAGTDWLVAALLPVSAAAVASLAWVLS